MTVAIDSNILIYAHNIDSIYYEKSRKLLFDLKKEEKIGISSISLIEFYQVTTDKNKIEKEYTEKQCRDIINSMQNDSNIEILEYNDTILFNSLKTVNKYHINSYDIYDHLIAYTARYYNIENIYTANSKDFKKYNFLNVYNPITING